MLRILKGSEVLWLSFNIIVFNCGAHFVSSGAAFTRFQTLRLRKIFPDILADQLISYGSCQFPTLGFVVERFKAIQAFVPEAFYKIKGMFRETQSWAPSLRVWCGQKGKTLEELTQNAAEVVSSSSATTTERSWKVSKFLCGISILWFLCQLALLSFTVTHDHEDGSVVFNWKRNRLFSHTACLVLYQMCMEVGKLVNSCIIQIQPNIPCICLVQDI